MRRLFLFAIALAGGSALIAADDIRLPLKEGSVRFALIGDSGTGDSHQIDVAKQMAAQRARVPFTFVLMMGDNLYGGDRANDYEKQFNTPYKPLLDAGVKFYASLGNHDNPNQRLYKPFLSGHEHFYERIKPQKGVAYFTLGSSAKVRRGDLLKTTLTEKGWDQGYAFMLIEIAGDDLYFETLSDTGVMVDSGVIHRTGRTAPTPGRSSQPVVEEKKTAPARAAQPG